MPAAGPSAVRGESPEVALSPASRSAQVYVLDRERRAELVPRVVRTAVALDGVDLAMTRPTTPTARRAIRGERGGIVRELRFAPARRSPRSPRGALEPRRRPRSPRPGRARRRARLPGLPGRPRPRLVGAALRDLRRRPAVRGARLRVRRLGRGEPHRRRLARLAARQRLARRAAVVRDRSRSSSDASTSGRCATSCRWSCGHFGVSRAADGGPRPTRSPGGAPRRRIATHPRGPWPRPLCPSCVRRPASTGHPPVDRAAAEPTI